MLTIVVTTVGWPTFLALQRASLDRFLTDEYQLIAVVDTPTASGPINLWGAEPRSEVIRVAREFVDEVLEMPEDLHNGGPRRRRDLFRRNVFHPSSRHGETPGSHGGQSPDPLMRTRCWWHAMPALPFWRTHGWLPCASPG